MAPSDGPTWIGPAAAAAVRLAAEATAEVDDILEHAAARPSLLSANVVRLEQSAELSEVATDLAALLWAECEDVPPIAIILEEPAAQAALEAVAESRRQAAVRLATTDAPAESAHFWRPEEPEVGTPEAVPPAPDLDEAPLPAPEPVPAPTPAAAPPLRPPATAGSNPAARRSATGAVWAGAAAAILVFGRRLRRA